ncbi:hypothetical protein VCHA53O466_50282 [Vibrio chagasii]|nr:hypothetical protein VCHA53O466_50282 [Vibrio chagasii]
MPKRKTLRLKKLPLQPWQRVIARKLQGLASERELKVWGQQCEHERLSYPNNGICTFGDGYYLQGEVSWFSYNGLRYDFTKNGKETFLHMLNRASLLEGFTTISDVKKLANLERRVHGSISSKTQRSLSAIFEINSKRNVKLKVMRFRKKIELRSAKAI